MSHRKKQIKHKIKGLRKKRSIFTRLWFWLVLLVLFIVLGIAYVVLFLPQLQIVNINISGNQNVATQDIKSIAEQDINKRLFTAGFLDISSKSILLFNANVLVNSILHAFPQIGVVAVQKNLWQTISVNVTERAPYAVFCQGQNSSQCFYMDNHGIIFESLQNLPQNMFVITNSQVSDAFLGEDAVDNNMVNDIANIQKNLQDNFQINIKNALVSDDLVITTGEGWQVYFDQTTNINTQIAELDALLSSQITPAARKNLQYIYLQYAGKAYYK